MDRMVKKSAVCALLMLMTVRGELAYAEPLVYSGRQQDGQPSDPQVADAQSRVVPVLYGTSYDSQFAPYASFMQAPQYSYGPLQQHYAQPNQSASRYPIGPQSGLQDPLHASEVSPYAHYSPYIEVVGEGSDYTLGIDDVVTIIVRNQPDFSGRFVVDPDGNIQYNFVGDIPADGKTKEELKAEIKKRLTRFVRYPEVAVMISEYRSKAVYVFGFINAPGKYAMKGDKITVKEAVVAAGLPRMDGSLNRVYIIRPSQYNKDGKPSKKKVNLDRLLNKGQSAEDFILQPGDTIVVHQRYFDKFVNAFSRIIGPVFQSAAVYELAWGGSARGFLKGGSDN